MSSKIISKFAHTTVEGALEVRVFNPQNHDVKARIALDAALCSQLPKRARRVDLEGRELETWDLENGVCEVALRAKEIATLRFLTENGAKAVKSS